MKTLNGFQKGINLGGWLSQGKLDKEHLDTFIVEDDIRIISTWGLDHVRLPVDFENIETIDGQPIEAGYQYIDNCIAWCKKYNLNLVIDLHKTYGYIFDDAEYSKDFFDNTDMQDRFIALWDTISKRYAADSDMLMFEMLNEVTRLDVVDEWNAIADRCMKTIRKNCPTVKILYGGVGYSAITSIKLLDEPIDENIVYNFHCYEPMIFTHQTAWWVDNMPSDFHMAYPDDPAKYDEETRKMTGAQVGAFADERNRITELGPALFEKFFIEAVEVAEKRGVTIYCGEYGVIDQAPAEDTVRWFKDINTAFTKHGIGRACWTYKEMDFGLNGEHYADVIEELVKYL